MSLEVVIDADFVRAVAAIPEDADLLLRKVEGNPAAGQTGDISPRKLMELLGIEKYRAPYNPRFLCAAVHSLVPRNPYIREYVDFLKGVEPALTCRYLSAALYNEWQRPFALEVLLSYGEREETVRAAGWAMTVPELREIALQFYKSCGPTAATVRSMMGALKNEDPDVRNSATNVLLDWGAKALPFINPPIPGSRNYGIIRYVIDPIKPEAA
ncbi:hypothetical protein HYY74_02855 [Candidatus Woesearchaeota archaeon]|nr:hypothetical protein [Candidatus Woesearchaeota archaeon]